MSSHHHGFQVSPHSPPASNSRQQVNLREDPSYTSIHHLQSESRARQVDIHRYPFFMPFPFPMKWGTPWTFMRYIYIHYNRILSARPSGRKRLFLLLCDHHAKNNENVQLFLHHSYIIPLAPPCTVVHPDSLRNAKEIGLHLIHKTIHFHPVFRRGSVGLTPYPPREISFHHQNLRSCLSQYIQDLNSSQGALDAVWQATWCMS